jgi:hypothetical protein
MFRIIILLLLVGLIALAFYLGWVHITTSSSKDNSESSITLSINKGKVKESLGTAREKVEGVKGKKEATAVHGKVQSISAEEIKVVSGTDQVVTVAIARETEMRGNPQQGDSVTVSYVTLDNRHIATSIRKD